jgi:hypothetical protein
MGPSGSRSVAFFSLGPVFFGREGGQLTRPLDKDYLILKRASMSCPSGEWSDDDFDVLADAVVVGRIMRANAAPVDAPKTAPTRYEPTREAAMAAFAKSCDGGETRYSGSRKGCPFERPCLLT